MGLHPISLRYWEVMPLCRIRVPLGEVDETGWKRKEEEETKEQGVWGEEDPSPPSQSLSLPH